MNALAVVPAASPVVESGPVVLGLVILGSISIVLGFARSLWVHRKAFERFLIGMFGGAAEGEPASELQPLTPSPQPDGFMDRIELWGQKNPVRTGLVIGLFFFVLAVAWSHFIDHSSSEPGSGVAGNHVRNAEPKNPPRVVKDHDRDGISDSRDRCPRVPSSTPSGCPPPKHPSLHPLWGSPDRWLADFVARRQRRIDNQSGNPPCVKLVSEPRLASGGLTCTIRNRQVDFLRFPIRAYARHYMGSLENKSVAAAVGGCEGAGPWHFSGRNRGRIAFLERHGSFLAIWSYSDHGRVLGLIRGSATEAMAICGYWEEEVL
jgi:hypothetical protein